MDIKYDKETDSLSIVFLENTIEDSDEIRAGVIADFDKDGSLVSIEILNASKKVGRLNEIGFNKKVLQVA
ncbi:MAG: DUF2283 domain-containing protein [Ignavibacteriae bacterium]|nr:DUF2283 domain-containing protein [Ignavibacteriota bacterium]